MKTSIQVVSLFNNYIALYNTFIFYIQLKKRPESAPTKRKSEITDKSSHKQADQDLKTEDVSKDTKPHSPTERDKEIARLMNKHLRRLKHPSPRVTSPKSPKSPNLPKSPYAVPLIKMSPRSSRSAGSQRSPKPPHKSNTVAERSNKEKEIDDMIFKHLKRPSSATVSSPTVSVDSSLSLSPPGSPTRDFTSSNHTQVMEISSLTSLLMS